jgi:hypothetical protein
MDRRIVTACAGAACGAIGLPSAHAAPYASGVIESAGIVTFRLNESADEVVVIRDGTPHNLGALGAGSHTFSRSGAATYQIVVNKNAAPGFLDPVTPTLC